MDKLSLFTILQIVSEMLPVSSSGHLNLCAALYQTDNGSMTLWIHFIHLPTLLIIGTYLWYQRSVTVLLSYAPIILISDAVTVVSFLIKKKNIVPQVPLFVGFGCTLLLLMSLLVVPARPFKANYWYVGFLVGCVQSVALMIPGLSRLAIVFVALVWLGATASVAFEIAWLVQLPLIVAAGIQAGALLHYHHQLMPLMCAEGFAIIAGSIGSLFTFGLSLHLLPRNRWYYFACYMVLPLMGALYLYIR